MSDMITVEVTETTTEKFNEGKRAVADTFFSKDQDGNFKPRRCIDEMLKKAKNAFKTNDIYFAWEGADAIKLDEMEDGRIRVWWNFGIVTLDEENQITKAMAKRFMTDFTQWMNGYGSPESDTNHGVTVEDINHTLIDFED